MSVVETDALRQREGTAPTDEETQGLSLQSRGYPLPWRDCHRWLARAWVRDVAALSFILLCVLVFFKDAVLYGLIYWEPDTITYYYPATQQLDDALRRGALQLWTPYIFGGFHLFADGESGTLYPPRLLLLLLLDAETGTIWLRILRFFLAGSFTFYFGRELGMRRYAATIAALVFALGSFLVGQLHHSNLANTTIWLPLVLLFTEKAFRGPGFLRYMYLTLAGVALAFSALAVHLQPVMLIMFTFACYATFRAFTVPDEAVPWKGLRWQFPGLHKVPEAVFRLRQASDPDSRLAVFSRLAATVWSRGWPRLWLLGQSVAIVFAMGIGLAAAQLVPLYELTRYSFRGYRLMYDFAVTFAASPHNLLTMVFPYFFRTAEGDPWSLWTFWETTIYVGIAPLSLGVLAAIVVRNRWVGFFGLYGLFALLLAFGDYLPLKLYWLLWNIPFFSFMRAPGRFISLYVFSMAILAGFGANWLIAKLGHHAGDGARQARRTALIAGTGIALFSGVLWAGVLLSRAWLVGQPAEAKAQIAANYVSLNRGNYLLNPEMAYKALLYNLDLSLPSTQVAFWLLGATAAIFIGWALWVRARWFWQIALLGLVAFDLLFFASKFHPLMSLDELTTPTPAGRFLIEHNGLHRVYTKWPATGTETNRMLPYGVAAVGGYSSLQPERHRELMRQIEKGSQRLLDLVGVRYIVATKQTPIWQQAGYKVVFEDSEVRIYENPHPLPRAMLVPSISIARSYHNVPEWLLDQQFDPTRLVIVEEAQSVFRDDKLVGLCRPPQEWEEAAKQPSPGRAEIIEYSPHKVTVRANANRDAMLLLTDAYHPGWRAYVDGQPEKIYLGDYLFRTLFVPAGEHTVEFIFDPLSFKVGIAISLIFGICLALFLGIGWWRYRRRALQ